MSFKDAFNELIFTYGLDILKDNFRTRAILSDLVGSSYYDIKLIDIFCKVLKNYDLFNIFSEKGLKDGRLYLNNVYKQYKELCNGKEFADAINPISQMICPKEYKEAEEKKKSIVVNNTEIHKQLKEQVNNGELNLTEKTKVKPGLVKYNPMQHSKIKKLEIEVEALGLIIKPSNTDKISVFIGNKEDTSLGNFEVIDQTLKMNLSKKDKVIFLYLPTNRYQSVSIKSTNALIDISDEIQFRIENLNIKTTNGNIYSNVSSKSIKLETTNGFIIIKGYIDKVIAQTTNGNIDFNLGIGTRKTLSIRTKTTNGNITGKFSDGKLNSKIINIPGKTRLIIDDIFIKECLIKLSVSTTNGNIKIE